MSHFLNVKNKDINIKAAAEAAIMITSDATLHIGNKASFLINDFGQSRLRVGSKKFKVDDKMNLFFYWPSSPTALKYYDDNSVIDKHRAEYDTVFDINSNKDLIGVVYVDAQSDSSITNQKIEEQIRKYATKYAKTPNFPSEEDGAWLFDTWQQFSSTYGNSVSYHFKPVFKLNRVNAVLHYYDTSKNKTFVKTEYSSSPNEELYYESESERKNFKDFTDSDIDNDEITYRFSNDGQDYPDAESINNYNDFNSYGGDYSDTYYSCPAEFLEGCDDDNRSQGNNLLLNERTYISTTRKEDLPDTLKDELPSVHYYQNTLLTKYVVKVTPGSCKDCSNNSIFWVYSGTQKSSETEYEAEVAGVTSEDTITIPEVSKKNYILNFTDFRCQPKSESSDYTYEYSEPKSQVTSTSEILIDNSEPVLSESQLDDLHNTGYKGLNVKFELELDGVNVGKQFDSFYEVRNYLAELCREYELKYSLSWAVWHWIQEDTEDEDYRYYYTSNVTKTTETWYDAFNVYFDMLCTHEIVYFTIKDDSISVRDITGKDFEKLLSDGKVSLENKTVINNMVYIPGYTSDCTSIRYFDEQWMSASIESSAGADIHAGLQELLKSSAYENAIETARNKAYKTKTTYYINNKPSDNPIVIFTLQAIMETHAEGIHD